MTKHHRDQVEPSVGVGQEHPDGGPHAISLYEPAGWNTDTGGADDHARPHRGAGHGGAAVLNRLGGWRDDCIGWVLAKLHERKRAVAEASANGGPDIT